MNTILFNYEVLLATATLLYLVIFIGATLLFAYLLRKWVRESVNSRHLEEIKPGEAFFYYDQGELKWDVCKQNHTDKRVIYTSENKRVKYENVIKL